MIAADREWNEGAAKAKLLQIFEAVGLEDPWVAAHAPQAVDRSCSADDRGHARTRISIFPLPGAVLYPGLQLPLHIFEPRYRALVSDALARDRRIAMIQPQRPAEGAPLFAIGCVGKIGEVEALDDGRYNIVLEGEARFRVLRELDVATPFRQVEAELLDEHERRGAGAGRARQRSSARRGASPTRRAMRRLGIGRAARRRLADQRRLRRSRRSMPPPSRRCSKPPDIAQRCELLVQLMQFFGRRDGDEDAVTLQ